MKRVRLYCLAAVCMVACRNGKSDIQQVQDKDMLIQVSKLNDESTGADNVINYKVRLVPDKQLMQSKASTDKTALFYRMDSCFYTTVNGKKNYAVLTQAVANGVSGTYEYLVEFEKASGAQADSVDLFYQDRYINKKNYHLKVSGQ